jgi:hypothetical protein
LEEKVCVAFLKELLHDQQSNPFAIFRRPAMPHRPTPAAIWLGEATYRVRAPLAHAKHVLNRRRLKISALTLAEDKSQSTHLATKKVANHHTQNAAQFVFALRAIIDVFDGII